MRIKMIALAGLLAAMLCAATGGAATNKWEDSDIRAYLNPEDNKTGYAAHFTDAEYKLMVGSAVQTRKTVGSTRFTNDKIFLPSGNDNSGMNQVISWGLKDLAGESSAADQKKYLIPKDYWAQSADPYGYSWLRSAYENSSEDALIYSKQVGVRCGYVYNPFGVAPVFTINTEDVFFASAVSAAGMLQADDSANKIIEIAKPSESNPQPDYGMYLKTVYEGKEFRVKNLSYNSHSKNLFFEYAGGMPGDCVVIQAYEEDAQSEGVDDTVVSYAAVCQIESGSGSMEISVDLWPESLAGMTIKVWMENPSRVNLAQATEPQTFVGGNNNIQEADGVEKKNLRQFAKKSELACSWGTSPSNQKIYFGMYFGMDDVGRSMEFWIADKGNDTLTLYQAKTVDVRAFDDGSDEEQNSLSVIPATPDLQLQLDDEPMFVAMQNGTQIGDNIRFISTNPHVATVKNNGLVKIRNYGVFSIMVVKQGTNGQYDEVGHSEPIVVVNPNPPVYTPAGTPDDGSGDEGGDKDDGDKDDGDKDDGKEDEGKAEDKGEAEIPADLPQTGDDSRLLLWAALAAACLLLAAGRKRCGV